MKPLAVLIYVGGPLWLRVLIVAMAVTLFVLMCWRYYQRYIRRR